jgi:hypothetical protein
MLSIGGAPYLALIRTAGAQYTFKIETGYHIRHISVTIIPSYFRIEYIKARGQDYRTNTYTYLLCFLIEIDGFVGAYFFAEATFFIFKIEAAFIYVSDKRDSLIEVDVNGFVL